jgi:molybdopterin-biosynthesis enzyme MoeA-like protein
VAKAFGVPIDTDPRAHEWVRTTGAEMNEARLRMTRIPKGADLIPQQGVGGTWLLDRQCNAQSTTCLSKCGKHIK